MNRSVLVGACVLVAASGFVAYRLRGGDTSTSTTNAVAVEDERASWERFADRAKKRQQQIEDEWNTKYPKNKSVFFIKATAFRESEGVIWITDHLDAKLPPDDREFSQSFELELHFRQQGGRWEFVHGTKNWNNHGRIENEVIGSLSGPISNLFNELL